MCRFQRVVRIVNASVRVISKYGGASTGNLLHDKGRKWTERSFQQGEALEMRHGVVKQGTTEIQLGEYAACGEHIDTRVPLQSCVRGTSQLIGSAANPNGRRPRAISGALYGEDPTTPRQGGLITNASSKSVKTISTLRRTSWWLSSALLLDGTWTGNRVLGLRRTRHASFGA